MRFFNEKRAGQITPTDSYLIPAAASEPHLRTSSVSPHALDHKQRPYQPKPAQSSDQAPWPQKTYPAFPKHPACHHPVQPLPHEASLPALLSLHQASQPPCQISTPALIYILIQSTGHKLINIGKPLRITFFSVLL